MQRQEHRFMISQIKRYRIEDMDGWSYASTECEDGPWVKWDDYEQLSKAARKAQVFLQKLSKAHLDTFPGPEAALILASLIKVLP